MVVLGVYVLASVPCTECVVEKSKQTSERLTSDDKMSNEHLLLE